MPKAKKKKPARAARPGLSLPGPSLAPQVLEEAAQGWLQSAGSSARSPRPVTTAADHRLAAALTETLQQLRAEISELRTRLDQLETR